MPVISKLFVYGSLMSGLGLHGALRKSSRVGFDLNPKVRGYQLVDLGAFPGAIPGAETQFVLGELYAVTNDVLRELDAVEGVPTFYERIQVRADGHAAWMYVLSKEFLQFNTPKQRVPGGDWRKYHAARSTDRR